MQLGVEDAPWSYLPPPWRDWLQAMPATWGARLEEVRFRVGRPVGLYAGSERGWLGPGGWYRAVGSATPAVERDELQGILQALCQHSRYAYQQELRQGFLTLPGGHRVGVAAEAVWEAGEIRRVGYVSGLNLRLAHAQDDAAAPVRSRLAAMGLWGRSLLIVAPPRGGKTTLLRALVRRISEEGTKVAVLDERREISGHSLGHQRFDLGPHTDVLAGWPKVVAGGIALRTLSPDLMAMDELGDPAEVALCRHAHASGVAVLATVHGLEQEALPAHPLIGPLLAAGVFAACVVLSPHPRPGTVRAVAALPAGER